MTTSTPFAHVSSHSWRQVFGDIPHPIRAGRPVVGRGVRRVRGVRAGRYLLLRRAGERPRIPPSHWRGGFEIRTFDLLAESLTNTAAIGGFVGGRIGQEVAQRKGSRLKRDPSISSRNSTPDRPPTSPGTGHRVAHLSAFETLKSEIQQVTTAEQDCHIVLTFETRAQIVDEAWGHIAFEMLKPENQQVTQPGPLQPTHI